MVRFGLRNEQVHESRENYLRTRGATAVIQAQHELRKDRLGRKVMHAEQRYPGMTQRLETETLQAIATDYNISRQRVHALLGNLTNLAKLRGITVAALTRQVIAAAASGA